MLAFYLAAHAQAYGWVDKIVANVPSPLAVTAEDVEDIRNSAVVLDEAWQFLSSRSEAISYGAALRKLGVILLMPSVFPPAQILASFSAQRFVNGYIFGLPLWGYNYYLNYKSFRDKGTFWLINPHLMSGWYDTEAYPAEDYGISLKLDTAVQRLKISTAAKLGKKINNEKKFPSTGDASVASNSSIDIPSLEGVAESFEDSANAIGNAIRKIRRR